MFLGHSLLYGWKEEPTTTNHKSTNQRTQYTHTCTQNTHRNERGILKTQKKKMMPAISVHSSDACAGPVNTRPSVAHRSMCRPIRHDKEQEAMFFSSQHQPNPNTQRFVNRSTKPVCQNGKTKTRHEITPKTRIETPQPRGGGWCMTILFHGRKQI